MSLAKDIELFICMYEAPRGFRKPPERDHYEAAIERGLCRVCTLSGKPGKMRTFSSQGILFYFFFFFFFFFFLTFGQEVREF